MSTHPVATQSPSVEEPVNLPEPQSLTPERLRAWSWHRQGLDGSLAGCTAEQVLARAGWARSVGGANPYLTLFARAGIRREQVDADVLAHRILELPVARGCTYVLGREDFAWALKLGKDAAEAIPGARPAGRGPGRNHAPGGAGAARARRGGGADGSAAAQGGTGRFGPEPRRGRQEEGRHHHAAHRPGDPAVAGQDPPRPGQRAPGPAALRLRALGPAAQRPRRRRRAHRADPPLPGLDRRSHLQAIAVVHGVHRGAKQGGARRRRRRRGAHRPATHWPRPGATRCGCCPRTSAASPRSRSRRGNRSSCSPERTPCSCCAATRRTCSRRRTCTSRRWDRSRCRRISRTTPSWTAAGSSDSGSTIRPRRRIVPWLFHGPTPAVTQRIAEVEAWIREDLGDFRAFSLDSPASRQKRIDALAASAVASASPAAASSAGRRG